MNGRNGRRRMCSRMAVASSPPITPIKGSITEERSRFLAWMKKQKIQPVPEIVTFGLAVWMAAKQDV